MTGEQIKNFKIFEEEKKEDVREKEIAEILRLWRNYSKKYRTYLTELNQTLEDVAKYKIKASKINTAKVARNWPSCMLYDIESEEQVRAFLEKISMADLYLHHEVCENTALNNTFRSTCVYIEDNRYKILCAKQKEKKAEEAKLFAAQFEKKYAF